MVDAPAVVPTVRPPRRRAARPSQAAEERATGGVVVSLDRALPPDGPLTVDQFLVWATDSTFAELDEDGTVIFLTTTNWHQQTLRFLLGMMQAWADTHGGGEVIPAPFAMRIKSTSRGKETIREPDILFVAPENLERLKEVYVDGPADIAVEIVIEESRTRDRNKKFFEYEAIGVREYWLIDQQDHQAEFYRRDRSGKFRRVALENDTLYKSEALPGFTLDVTWLWQTPLPTLMSIVKGWNLPD